MSKVATYLRGHLLGEVDFRTDARHAYARDAGVLGLVPEMVITPHNTNDIRKVARFAWQLAEKGHVLSLTARGSGHGTMGGAVGKGAIIAAAPHMNNIFEYDSKQRLARLQPGVSVGALRDALSLQGTGIMALDGIDSRRTIGGVIADNVAGYKSGKYGDLGASVSQLEVVLASGDVLQTGRLNKRELSQKKGLQTLEGDIYRGIDNILDEYADVIAALPPGDRSGYSAIADVRQSGGGFDLTPLFLGTQGTLGVISEMIVRADFRSQRSNIFALVFASVDMAADAMDMLRQSKLAFAEYFDAQFFNAAVSAGRQYDWYSLGSKAPAAVIIAGFDDFNDRARSRGLKKIEKTFGGLNDVTVMIAEDDAQRDALYSALNVARYTTLPDKATEAAPRIYTDLFIPSDQFVDFTKALADLAGRMRCVLPLAGHAITQRYSVYPRFSLRQVSDKQKLLKLLDELAILAKNHGGALIGQVGEGRIAAHFAHKQLDERTRQMYAAIKSTFDPFGIMNPGVKSGDNLRSVTASLESDLSGL